MKQLTIYGFFFLLSAVSANVIYTYASRQNWALKKNVSQSSTNETYTADRAVDGNNTNGFLDGGSCSQTKQSDKPWWTVRIGAFIVVDEVVVVNRGDCCGEELSIFDIIVLEGPMSVVGVCYSNNRILKTGDTVLFQCTVPLIGEHVQIKLQGKGILTLCEVKVYGRPYIVGSDSGSWAVGMPAEQSTATSKGAYPGQAVDGEFSGDFKKHKCAQTKPTDPNPWWMVDMMIKLEVTLVRIWNRLDCCSDNLQNLYIEVMDSKTDRSPRLCAHVVPPVQTFVRVVCKKPLAGQWLRIRKVRKPGLNGDLTLCEVEVSGRRIVTDGEFLKKRDNYAVGRKARQSSSGSYGRAYEAVDGNVLTSLTSDTCTMTAAGDTKQWWMVTFDHMFVEAVAIVLPNYCCSEDLSQWIIWVDDKVKCGSLSNNVPPASIVSTSCPAHTQGTFVSIYKRPIRKYISLCEVEVYGIPPELRNWALGKTTYLDESQSPEQRDRLVDGDLSNGLGTIACPRITSKTSPLRLVVDLGDAHVYVEKILYYTAAGPDAHTTLQDVKIELRDDSKQNVYLGCQPDRVQFPPGFVVTVTCQGTKPQSLANKVTLINGNKVKLLNLCEVEIYGKLAFIK